jgi:hypothetical protein
VILPSTAGNTHPAIYFPGGLHSSVSTPPTFHERVSLTLNTKLRADDCNCNYQFFSQCPQMCIGHPSPWHGAACWDPYRKGQIHALDRVQNAAARFAHHRNDSNWETLTQRRKVSRICALFKAYMGERAWKAIGDRLERPYYLSTVDHDRKIRSRKQKTDIGKHSFANRTIQLWNQLPAHVLETLSCKQSNFKKRVRKVIKKAK